MTRKLEKKQKPQPKPEPQSYREVETFSAVLDNDDFVEHNYNQRDNNPFEELQQLITGEGIDKKTVLTERQVVVMHKLSTLETLYRDSGDKEGAALIHSYAERFMTLIINKDGLSRNQYIEAINRGREKAEESRREKIAEKMGQIL